jgi:hypothetical protein
MQQPVVFFPLLIQILIHTGIAPAAFQIAVNFVYLFAEVVYLFADVTY